MQYTPELHWRHSGSSEAMAGELRLAHGLMDRSKDAPDLATARGYYAKARVVHDAVDRRLRSKLPTSAAARTELGAAIAKLRSRLVAYESMHS